MGRVCSVFLCLLLPLAVTLFIVMQHWQQAGVLDGGSQLAALDFRNLIGGSTSSTNNTSSKLTGRLLVVVVLGLR